MSERPEEKFDLTGSEKSAPKSGRITAKKVIRTIGEQLLFVAPKGYVPLARPDHRHNGPEARNELLLNESRGSIDDSAKLEEVHHRKIARKNSVWGRIAGGRGK